MKCAYCGKEVLLYDGFECSFCGKFVCKEHRMPESHACKMDSELKRDKVIGGRIGKIMEKDNLEINKTAPPEKRGWKFWKR